MRKLTSLSLGIALASTIFVALPAAAAEIDGNLGPCAMPGAGVNGEYVFGGVGTLTHQAVNGMQATMVCESTGITNDSGSTAELSGFECGVTLPDGEMIWTHDSHATITTWGRATLTCNVAVSAA